MPTRRINAETIAVWRAKRRGVQVAIAVVSAALGVAAILVIAFF